MYIPCRLSPTRPHHVPSHTQASTHLRAEQHKCHALAGAGLAVAQDAHRLNRLGAKVPDQLLVLKKEADDAVKLRCFAARTPSSLQQRPAQCTRWGHNIGAPRSLVQAAHKQGAHVAQPRKLVLIGTKP